MDFEDEGFSMDLYENGRREYTRTGMCYEKEFFKQ